MSEKSEVAVQTPSANEILASKDMMDRVKNRAKSLGEKAVEDLVVYVKMTKAGDWVHGEGEEELDEDARYVVNPLSYQYGAVAFSDNKFVDEKLVSAFGDDPIPMPEDLEKEIPIDKIESSDGWKPQHGIVMVNAEGGSNMVYKASSGGGIRALETLIGKVGERMDSEDSGELNSLFPVIRLESSWYKHKKYGKTYNPQLTLVGWAANDSAEIVEEVDPEED